MTASKHAMTKRLQASDTPAFVRNHDFSSKGVYTTPVRTWSLGALHNTVVMKEESPPQYRVTVWHLYPVATTSERLPLTCPEC